MGTPPPRLLRQRWKTGVAVLALILGGLAGWIAWAQMSAAQDVLVASHAIEKFQVIEPDDVRVVSGSLDPSVASIAGSDAGSLVGQRATEAIPAGALLAPDHVSGDTFPPSGTSVVPLALPPGSGSGTDLEPGDLVRAVVLPDSTTSDSEPSYTEAEIVSVYPGSGASQTVVAVLVPHEEAIDLASQALDGTVTIVRDAGAS